uniref:Uncharacterized protein n=1 Tax=Physcomitrium patens TaxID=3218 RepID=A0A2K1ICD1_PHYPA|nr:hypothetical protein PHYPA_030397 [Physcomitrium patens]
MEIHLFVVILMPLLLMIERPVMITIKLEEYWCWIALLISLLFWFCKGEGVFVLNVIRYRQRRNLVFVIRTVQCLHFLRVRLHRMCSRAPVCLFRMLISGSKRQLNLTLI